MSARGVAFLAAIGAVLALTGCVTPADASPMCDEEGRNTLVLMAQSIPEAEHVPCIAELPPGWYVNDIEIKSGQSRVALSNDRSTGDSVVTMTFVPACDVGDAVEIPSDERDARRYEDVEAVTNGYRGTSYLLVDGACVRLAFNVAGDGWSALVNDASAAFTLASRSELERYVREYSNGVIEHL